MLPEGYYFRIIPYGAALFYKGRFVKLFATEKELYEYFEEK